MATIDFVDDEGRQVPEWMTVRSYLAMWDCGDLIIPQPLVLQSKCDGACEGREWSSDDCIERVCAGHRTEI